MWRLLNNFLADQSGATSIEYGLIASLIAVVLISSISNAGTKLNAKFTKVSNALN